MIKKLNQPIIALTVCFILTVSVIITITAMAGGALKGDIDGDGIVSVSDVVALRSIIMKGEILTGDALYTADLDGDGSISVSDVVALRGLIMNGGSISNASAEQSSSSDVSSSDSTSSGDSGSGDSFDFSFKNKDTDASYEEEKAVQITLNGDSAAVSGSGASVDGTDIVISEKGTYIVSGTLRDGRLIVAADDSVKVQVVLKNANITCTDNAPLLVKSGDKVYLTLAAGTANSLTGGSAYNLAADETGIDGVIYSKSDLTINGSGTLNISANYKHAIVSKDDLVITGGDITVNSVGGGLYGKDCVKIAGGTFHLTVAGDGIQSNNTEDSFRGYVYIKDGNFTINSANDGIQAETIVYIEGGMFAVTSGGGSNKTVSGDVSAKAIKATAEVRITGGTFILNSAEDTVQAGGALTLSGGNFTIQSAADGMQAETSLNISGGEFHITSGGGSGKTVSADVSVKGLKCAGDIMISDGIFILNTADDAVHSNTNITVSGGAVTVSSGDDGIHADTSITVNAGTIDIKKSYEGVEATSITVNGGTITLVASDDGFNASGGNDGSAGGGRPGQNNFTGSNGSIVITGGNININASGDGIDSNGSLSVSGGYTYVSGPTDNGNGALDYDGTAQVTGGVLIAAGSTGMAQNFSTASGQCSLLYNFTSTISGGSAITLKDSSGTVLATFTPAKNYQSIVITTPDMQVGKSYTLTAGTQSATVSLTSLITSQGTTGGGPGGGPGGPR